MLISEFDFAHFLQNYSSDLFQILRCDRNNIFPHFYFSTDLLLSKFNKSISTRPKFVELFNKNIALKKAHPAQ